jgi:hypothetical protein
MGFRSICEASIDLFSLVSRPLMGLVYLMKNSSWMACIAVGTMMWAASLPKANAQLPALNDAPWLGYNAVFANKRFQFGVTSLGKISLTPIGDKGAPVSHTLAIDLEIGIEESLPTGKVVVKKVQPGTLSSSQPATDKLEKTMITGKTTGDAAFELHIEQDRGMIAMGGRLVDPGTLKNPLRFTIHAKFPTAYPYDKPKDLKEEKTFEKKIEDDRIDLKWTDGKRIKQNLVDSVTASSPEINGPGIEAAQIEMAAYKGKKFVFMASPGSSMNLASENTGPLHKGFAIVWVPDPAKDKDGKARLSFEVK